MVWLPNGEKISKVCLFILKWSMNVTDTQIPHGRLCIASRSKKSLWCKHKAGLPLILKTWKCQAFWQLSVKCQRSVKEKILSGKSGQNCLLLAAYLVYSWLMSLCITFWFRIMHCCIPTPTTDSNTSTGMNWRVVTLIVMFESNCSMLWTITLAKIMSQFLC